jgi:hypothetical protein
MVKKVNSATVSLWDILSSTCTYSIPYNQRPYTWNLKNWETLWTSFFSENDKSVFLGSIILLDDTENVNDAIKVYDGQQRLTTLTIMCKAFIDVLYENSFIQEATQIKVYLLTDSMNKPRLTVSQKLQTYFKENIQCPIDIGASPGQTDSEKEIYKSYQYFKDMVSGLLDTHQTNGAKLYELLENRLRSLEIVKLTIADVLLGIEIFESVNATGEKLNASELAKNILIKHARLSGKKASADLDLEWTEISERLQGVGFSFVDFLHYHWISKYQYVGKSQLFNAMKKKYGNNSADWLDFFENLKATSVTIENIFSLYTFPNFKLHYPHANGNPKYSDRYLRYLRCLSFVKNKSWIIPIFTLLNYETDLNKRGESYINSNSFHILLEKHFVFCFLHFNVFSLPTRDFTPSMYKLAKAINRALADNPQNATLSNKAVKDAFQDHYKGANSYVKRAIKGFEAMPDEFLDGVLNLRHTKDNKYLIHALYGEIEEGIYGGTFHNIPAHSIEHYMPQESSASWGITKEISKQHENKLGNILIIDASLNGKLQNKSHRDKMDILRNHPTLNNSVKDFIRVNDSGNGPYDFGMLTETQLKNSDPLKSPTEIDKRTIEISNFLKVLFIDKMKY